MKGFGDHKKSQNNLTKNLKKINNKSLVYRAVEFTKRIRWISKVVCSSDDQNILNEAK